jgi:NADH:ubiquinone oxidoreductase subunit E
MTEKLEAILQEHRSNGGNIISLLQSTQEAFGYIPREAVQFFSDELGLAPSRFYGVATFYSQFRLTPVGKHRVTACCGTACHVRGAERIISGIERELRLEENEDTTRDGKITLEKVACLGFCSFAPIVLVDGAVHGKVSTDTVIKEIKALRKK